jgi:hypothetical protein
MFHVNNALVSLFFDRRVYIIDGTGAFAVSGLHHMHYWLHDGSAMPCIPTMHLSERCLCHAVAV